MDLLNKVLPEWLWWREGKCVIKVISIGHFPTTIIAKLPNDKQIEIDIDELEITNR
jgi:hypothetical protein